MKTKQTHLLTALCALALFALPATFAAPGDTHFRKTVTEGNGFISLAEHTVSAKAMFDRIDTDRNGTITLTEMEASKGLGDAMGMG